ncbi:hypothetical protein [Kitasatospora sp. GAS204B]|nr:hypothetical protein [Kitasatospora sp. GAS204B]MDH6122860.1 hypothetical protein [Kitasatospora sp. GAS204B]
MRQGMPWRTSRSSPPNQLTRPTMRRWAVLYWALATFGMPLSFP